MTTTSMPHYIFSIDTLQFSKRLQKAGLQEAVANELAETLKDAQSQSLEGLATKQDLAILEKDIIIKLGSLMAFGIGIIAILIKF